MRKILYMLPLLFVCVIGLMAQEMEAQDYATPYAQLLSRYLTTAEKDGIETAVVDYEGWGNDSLHNSAMNAISKVDPSELNGRAQKAFWINAYNLLTIDLIIRTGEKDSIKNQGSLFRNVWKSHNWEIAGTSYTLDEIENDILRPLGDPRIHMAINCASISCPDLRAEPYMAEKLDSQLDGQARLFVANESKGVAITAEGLRISKIFDWFSDDFGGESGVKNFIRKYSATPLVKDDISGHFSYNWKLNSR